MSAATMGCGKPRAQQVRVMRHDPAGAAIFIMLRSLKLPGMAQAPLGTLLRNALPGSGGRPDRTGGTCMRRSHPHTLTAAQGGNGRKRGAFHPLPGSACLHAREGPII
jgi:hypothetical protein